LEHGVVDHQKTAIQLREKRFPKQAQALNKVKRRIIRVNLAMLLIP
jgi:hypothetical protein